MAEKSPEKAMYRSPAVQMPTLGQLSEICGKLGYNVNREDLEEYRGIIKHGLESYQRVYELVEPKLPVKYPRTPGYQPDKHENPYNAWYVKTDIHGAASGKLAGKLLAIKDTVMVAGVPMMNGSKVLEGYIPDIDATIVTRILDEGGRILGKSTCEDFSFSAHGCQSSRGPVINPHDATCGPGGSTSGGAVLVQIKEVDMAIGGDQAGSIRLPSCWTGIVGLKPTRGLVPYTGIMPIEQTFDHTGPLANTVYDCALLLEVIAGYDGGLDTRQPVNLEVREYTSLLRKNLDGVRIGVVQEGFLGQDPDVDRMVRRAAFQLASAGATVEEVSIPMHNDAHHVFLVISMDGSYQQLVRGNSYGYNQLGHYSTSLITALHNGFKARPDDVCSNVKAFSINGEYIQQNYGNILYAKASNLRRTVTDAYDQALSTYDVLIMPTIPYTATKFPPKDIGIKDLLDYTISNIKNTAPFNLTGHPALSINTGFSKGLPVGMQITGRMFDEQTVLKVAYAYECLRDGHN